MTQLVYQGQIIDLKADRMSLTSMWKAAGEPENKRPAEWARKEGSAFIEAVSVSLNMAHSHIMKTQRGKGGATWAHWQIAFAYAKYLSTEFHMWCNTQVRAVMEGRAAGTASGLSEYDRQIIGSIVKNCTGVMVREALAPMVAELAEAKHELEELRSRIESPSTCSAGELWAEEKWPSIRGGTVWLGNRLIEMGCSPDYGSRSKLGGRWRRLFDAGKARAAIRNGLGFRVERYIAESIGQKKFKL
ncbi:KilA-N domain-containing protein [Neorhizobium sp. NCHU2750]|uniref:KilA-N domain-containing protein n=1 Tax=Neorhizobium sp. NCHU2750 TaxID=1825976 RepID=UPI000E726F89|nr:hypothetical protein NCHU2750_28390 [Neorhizobium sp. NCHU2750]